MELKSIKSLLVLIFSGFLLVAAQDAFAQHEPPEQVGNDSAQHAPKKEGFDAKEVIFGHIMDAHEFHFVDYKGSDGKEHAVTIPLPVILYSSKKGLTVFSSSHFEHGHAEYQGYKLVKETIGEKIVSTDAAETVYDFSLTRNVVQMMLALAFLVWLLISIANAYAKGLGVTTAPKGKQNLMEPIIIFVRDEVAIPNLGHKAMKYLPYLLTVFFFILINNIIGLIPGTANVTGNIAFTAVLGLISFVVILASSNKHYWLHIFNPPGVPLGVKFILVPVPPEIRPKCLSWRVFSACQLFKSSSVLSCSGGVFKCVHQTICIDHSFVCQYGSRPHYYHLFDFTHFHFCSIEPVRWLGSFSFSNWLYHIYLFY